VVAPPHDWAWCEVGDEEFNVASRYSFAGDVLVDGDLVE
jgi:hypothetical protein